MFKNYKNVLLFRQRSWLDNIKRFVVIFALFQFHQLDITQLHSCTIEILDNRDNVLLILLPLDFMLSSDNYN